MLNRPLIYFTKFFLPLLWLSTQLAPHCKYCIKLNQSAIRYISKPFCEKPSALPTGKTGKSKQKLKLQLTVLILRRKTSFFRLLTEQSPADPSCRVAVFNSSPQNRVSVNYVKSCYQEFDPRIRISHEMFYFSKGG